MYPPIYILCEMKNFIRFDFFDVLVTKLLRLWTGGGVPKL